MCLLTACSGGGPDEGAVTAPTSETATSTGDDAAGTSAVLPPLAVPPPTEPATQAPETSTAGTSPDSPTTDSPTPPESEGPWDAATLQRAEEIVAGLSVHEKAGQVFVASHMGAEPPVGLVVDQHLGGVILMDPTLTTDQVRHLNQTLSEAAAQAGREWPVFLAVDQEGGIVERAKGDLTRFPSFMSYGAADDVELTRAASAASGAELRGVGFTVDFAPEADVTMGRTDPTIGSRSAGGDPDLVARHAVAAAQGYLDAGILPVIKHFPGHGSVPADSHETLPVQTKSLEELRASDLVPFVAGVEAGLPAVMVAHLEVAALGSTVPSTLEPKVVDGMLREELGFEGLVVTDALDMAAVTQQFGAGEAAVRALEAGVDVVLMSPSPLAARDAVEQAVVDGRLPEERLDEAVTRQIAALLSAKAGATVEPLEPGGARVPSRDLSRAAVTVVAGGCSGPLVDGGIVPVGDAAAIRRLTQAAERAGVPVGSGTVVELVGYGQGLRGGADVVVALDTPYVLGSSGAPVRIAVYGDTPGAMVALLDVLTGEQPAPGRLPVAVDGVERAGC